MVEVVLLGKPVGSSRGSVNKLLFDEFVLGLEFTQIVIDYVKLL
jgi:hypothetical protein